MAVSFYKTLLFSSYLIVLYSDITLNVKTCEVAIKGVTVSLDVDLQHFVRSG